MCNLDNILEKCKKGDRKAAEQFYRMFSAKMFALCIRYSHNRTEAEDHLQDGFIKIFDSLGQYSGKGSLEGWMRRIFINMIFEKYRKERPVQLVEDIPDIEDTEIESSVTIPEEVLLRFMTELPEKYRLVFNLYAIEEMSHKEIATLAGISEGTSKSNLARARDILKRKVNEYLQNGQ